MRINGTIVLNCRPLRGVVEGTSIPLQDMIERSHLIDIDLIPQFRDTINTLSLPVRVRSEINAVLEARLPQYLPHHNTANIVYQI